MEHGEYRKAMDALAALGVSATEVARAVGVSLNSVSRARMETGNRRSPPPGWKPAVRGIISKRIAGLAHLLDSLADA
jgi:hypothetical protein